MTYFNNQLNVVFGRRFLYMQIGLKSGVTIFGQTVWIANHAPGYFEKPVDELRRTAFCSLTDFL